VASCVPLRFGAAALLFRLSAVRDSSLSFAVLSLRDVFSVRGWFPLSLKQEKYA
jgi:hypothetical protein